MSRNMNSIQDSSRVQRLLNGHRTYDKGVLDGGNGFPMGLKGSSEFSVVNLKPLILFTLLLQTLLNVSLVNIRSFTSKSFRVP